MSSPACFDGCVRGIVGTDMLLVINRETGAEEQICLASLNAPRMPRRDGSSGEAFSFEAREYLRLLTVGELVRCQVVNEVSGRCYFDVTLLSGRFAKYNVNEAIVREGLATVHKNASRKAEEYFQRLVDAEQDAREAERNIHSVDVKCEATEFRDAWNKSDMANEFLEQNKGIPVNAIIEGIISPTLYRLTVPSKKRDKPHLSIQCSLAGVTSNTNQHSDLEMVTDEARAWLDSNLYQRDVRFVATSTNGSGMLSGVIHHSKSNTLNYDLVLKGFVHVNENSLRDDENLYPLNDALKLAKEQRNGVHSSYAHTDRKALKTFEGSVIEVVNGECVIVSDHEAKEPVEFGQIHRVYLASVRAPRMGSTSREADPLAEEAKEKLIELVGGKHVSVRIELTKATPEALLKLNMTGPGAIQPEMQCGSIFVKTKNIALDLLAKGLVTVPYFSGTKEEDRGFDHQMYIVKEGEAKAANLGVHNTNAVITNPRFADLTGREASQQKSKQYEATLQKSKNLTGTILHAYSAGRFKVRFNTERLVANMTLTNLAVAQGARPPLRGQAAREADPMHEEAMLYSKFHLLNKKIKFEVLSCDRGGSFLCKAFVDGQNFGNQLLQKGYGSIPMPFRATETQIEIQDLAMESKVGIWSDDHYRNSYLERHAPAEEVVAPVATDDLPPPVVQGNITIVHVNSVHDFYVSDSGDKTQKDVDALQGKLQSAATTARPFEAKINAPCLAVFSDDGAWYRARVEKIDRKTKSATVVFVDFGNSQCVRFSMLRELPMEFAFSKLRPYATQYCLVGCTDKPDSSDKAASNLFEFSQLPPYTMTVFPSSTTAKGGRIPYVIISDGTKSINAQLLEEGNAIISQKRMPINLGDQTLAELEKASNIAMSEKMGQYKYIAGAIASDEEDTRE